MPSKKKKNYFLLNLLKMTGFLFGHILNYSLFKGLCVNYVSNDE